jgi:hypothetical protein
MNPTLVNAVPYDPAFEVEDAGEADTKRELVATLRKIEETVYKDSGHAERSVHAKSHGLLRGTFSVYPNLPPELAQGVFATTQELPVVLRLSTTPGDVLDDHVSTPRGVAMKIVGVDGARLPGGEGDATQDFIMVNGPAFMAPNPKKFLGNLKLLATTTDKAPGLKKALSAALRGAEKTVEAFGGEVATFKALGGHPLTNILGETFYTQVPMLYGRYMAKLSLAPLSPQLIALKNAALDMKDHPNAIRDAVVAFFASNDAEWELRVQLCTDLAAMPIEDASVVWPEGKSPYVGVARIRVPRQRAWSAERSAAVDEGMSFNPWHCVAAHRPLGSVMRARKAAYEASAAYRAERNGRTLAEPRDLDAIPD